MRWTCMHKYISLYILTNLFTLFWAVLANNNSNLSFFWKGLFSCFWTPTWTCGENHLSWETLHFQYFPGMLSDCTQGKSTPSCGFEDWLRMVVKREYRGDKFDEFLVDWICSLFILFLTRPKRESNPKMTCPNYVSRMEMENPWRPR